MTKYLPSIIAVASALAGIFAAPVQAAIASHPSVFAVLTSILAIVAHLMPQPQKLLGK